MSRIDAALNRTSRGGPRRAVSPAPGGSPRNVTLDDYPVEATEAGVGATDSSGVDVLFEAPAAGGEQERVALRALALPDAAKLMSGDACNPVSLEQYRRLAASLHELQVERGLKTLVVTSSVPREGKTLTAVNLALTLSESYGRRVLLIDADLRRPAVHQVLDLPNETGLGEFLRSDSRELPVVQASPRLSVLPAGKADRNPLAGLSSDRLRLLLEDAGRRYDWVILDTPPLGLLSDAQILTRLTQAAVFVVRAGATPFPVVGKALDDLGREHVVGLVLNGVDESAIGAAAQYYGYYDQTN